MRDGITTTTGDQSLPDVAALKDGGFVIVWRDSERGGKTYGDIFLENEVQHSTYNFEVADTEVLTRHFVDAENECARTLEAGLPLPAYDQCLKASHLFNLLDARGVISVTERAAYIGRVRALAKGCCELWVSSHTDENGALV